MKITGNLYSDRRIPLVRPSVKMLPINFLSYIDGMNPSIKLFNGLVDAPIKNLMKNQYIF
jgi:hypothetical protein